jgi:hypothetical protein
MFEIINYHFLHTIFRVKREKLVFGKKIKIEKQKKNYQFALAVPFPFFYFKAALTH